MFSLKILEFSLSTRDLKSIKKIINELKKIYLNNEKPLFNTMKIISF